MNVVHWSGKILFYTTTVLLGSVGVSLLMAVLTASAGVLFSLKAATAQEAQQTLMAVLLIPLLVLQFGSFFLMSSDTGKARLSTLLTEVTLREMTLVIAAVLLLVDAVLLVVVAARFRRSRLIPAYGSA